MSWFGLLQSVKRDDDKESLTHDHRDPSSPTEWEVLSQGEREVEVEMSSAATSESGDEFLSEDEKLTVIKHKDDDLKNPVEVLRNQLATSQREKQSLEERLQQQDIVVEDLKGESNRVAAQIQSELNEAHQEAQKAEAVVDRVEREMAKMEEEIKAVTEELHQAEVLARLETKATRVMLEEKSQQMAKTERDNEALREELDAAKEHINKLVLETKGLKEDLALSQEVNDDLREQSRSLKREIQLLKDESQRVTTQNFQALAALGVHTLERGDAHAFATKPDLVGDAEVVKMLEELNSEIFEAAAYMADSFTFSLKLTKTDEVREASSRATKMLGGTIVLSLASVQHDEDPLIVQIACQASMVECCQRIIASWCIDGSKAEEVLPDLYNKIRKTEAHAGHAISGRWRALTRTLVRSTLGQTRDVSSRLTPPIFDAIVDVLLVAGCQGTRTQVHEKLTARFKERISILATMALRLNEVIGEDITSCDLKANSVPYGAAFSARTMDDVYDDGRWHGLAPESPQILCTTELGLQKEVKRCDGKAVWQRAVLAKPKVALESLPNGMQLRD